jgi:hypothetical protein
MNQSEMTLNTLQKITDFPFYVARYCGDYKIKDFINGAIKGPQDVIPFFEDLFMRQGIPVSIPTNISVPEIPACSAFFVSNAENGPMVGKNLDWKKSPILLLKTKQAGFLSSFSIIDLSLCDLFGINSFAHSLAMAPYVPFDGMNESGLVVTMLSVQGSCQYPIDSKKTMVGDFNIIRIVLDTCTTVEMAIDCFKKYSIMQTGPLPIHYLIADQNRSSIVEFVNGDVKVIDLAKYGVVTNNIVEPSSGFKENRKICNRFNTLFTALESEEMVTDIIAKRLLNKVALYQEAFQPPSTIWSVLFYPKQHLMKVRPGISKAYYRVNI